MLECNKIALHYDVISNTANRIAKIAKEIADLNRASYINVERLKLRKGHLQVSYKELIELIERNT